MLDGCQAVNLMKGNGIKHIPSAPYHPSTNGSDERFVQSFKMSMRLSKKEGESVGKPLQNSLP